jgi:hypothetical protein
MSDGQKIGGKTTIPVGDMAKANLDKIFPHLTPEQVTAIREGKPVPPSPDWQTTAVAPITRPVTNPADLLQLEELSKKYDEAREHLRVTVRRNQVFEGFLYAGKPHLPTVSAILVFSDRNRLRRARKAVNQFVSQSYPNKQIIIVNASDLEITNVPHREVVELKYNTATTGELRNYALSKATGELVFPFWDDDDVYDPDLLAFLVAARAPGKAVMLSSQIRIDIKNSVAYVHREADGIPNTLLCPKTDAMFPEQTGGEDFAFVQHHWAMNSSVVDSSPFPLNTLIMRVHDGNNVRTAEEFMVGHHTPDKYGKWELAANEAEHMKAVLATFGLKAEARLPQEAPQPATV